MQLKINYQLISLNIIEMGAHSCFKTFDYGMVFQWSGNPSLALLTGEPCEDSLYIIQVIVKDSGYTQEPDDNLIFLKTVQALVAEHVENFILSE